LPGVSTKAASPVAEPETNVQYGYYVEEGNRMEAQIYHGDFIIPINDFLEFTFSHEYDTNIGATPSHSTPQVMTDVIVAASDSDSAFDIAFDLFKNPDVQAARSAATGTALEKIVAGYEAITKRPISNFKPVLSFATHPRESRNMPVFGANLYLGDLTIALSGGTSIEPDFESTFGSINLSWELNNKLTTLSTGYSLTTNDITRNTGIEDRRVFHHGSASQDNDDTEEFRKESTFHSINLGLSQVMTKNTLFHLNGSYTNQAGYLTNPYKNVYVRGEITAQEYAEVVFRDEDDPVGFSKATNLEAVGPELFREVRPDKRHKWSISTGVNHHIPSLDASLHLDYRYYIDSWDISSHTFEFSWYQNLPFGLTVTPSIRYYSQSAAYFFAPFFLAPRADGYYSSDYRLSGFGKLSAGISISKEFAKGVRLNAGFEYSSHRGSLKLGGDGIDDYADIDSFLISGSLHVNLSSLGRTGNGNSHHNRHAYHGGHPPAGVMFGHMLDKAGDMMVGYHYKYGNSSGGMRHGTHGINDQQLTSRACVDLDCTFKPGEMTMHMHMFNFMYAPTDWLTLAVMPQIISMDMEMQPIDPEDGAGGHDSAGLGDTLMVALVKLFDNNEHHLHLGLGFSAPTGSIETTFDNTESEESGLLSFGMQLGSGTWDFKPSLTYTGNTGRWYWGAQVTGTKRMQSRNKLGYTLGDEIQGSVWGGYRVLDWLSLSVRNIYQAQSEIRGQLNRVIPATDPPTPEEPTSLENPANYGGQFWDIGLGVNLSAPNGEFAGHSLSIEWLQPVIHDFNGYQLERNGSLSVRWGYAF
jgi:hypothetical protein